MKFQEILILLFCVFSPTIAKDYSNYEVYDVTPNKQQVEELMRWQFEVGIDFWATGGVSRPSKIIVSSQIKDKFLRFLTTNKIHFNLVVRNVEESLKAEQSARNKFIQKRGKLANIDEPNFELYWTNEEMESYTLRLALQHPNLVKRDVIGKSIEGRDISALRISSGSEFGKKPIIFIDTGTHAREWIGPHTVLYFVDQLVTNSSVTQELLEKVDWVVVPNVNPDGYVYAQTEDRFWRKNRRPVNYTCTGIDLNRNYGYLWKQVPNSCSSSNYAGAHPLSEPESFAVAKYMESFKFNLRLYMSVHSAGAQILWPFGFKLDAYVKNWKEHDAVGQLWADAIFKATGKEYEVGNSADVLYTANGASDDYALATANANLAYTIELPPGDFNWQDYPQDMIYKLAKGTFFGYRALGLYIGAHYNYK